IPLLSKYGNLTNQQDFLQLVDDVCALVELNPVTWNITFNRNEIAKSCNTNSIFEVFRVIYNLKSRKENAKFWVCKSMANVNFAREMEVVGILPKYIYLYRDGRDVACSFKKAVVGEKHVFHIANKWAANQKACFKLHERTDTSRFISLSYENLTNEPEKEMKRIGTFLNIPFNPKIFDFYKSKESQNTAIAGKMWANVVLPILGGNSNKFKKELSEMEIAIFEKQAGDVLTRLGYQLIGSHLLNEKPFSEVQISTFNYENNLLKEKVNRFADPIGMERRKGQEQKIKEILSRY
ncbi:MAG: sulfotransferase, partial [Draconibacterium sp.]|nr:sulfotransferase [Draconibacterium sp.]